MAIRSSSKTPKRNQQPATRTPTKKVRVITENPWSDSRTEIFLPQPLAEPSASRTPENRARLAEDVESEIVGSPNRSKLSTYGTTSISAFHEPSDGKDHADEEVAIEQQLQALEEAAQKLKIRKRQVKLAKLESQLQCQSEDEFRRYEEELFGQLQDRIKEVRLCCFCNVCSSTMRETKN
jgi:hypothetical protein